MIQPFDFATPECKRPAPVGVEPNVERAHSPCGGIRIAQFSSTQRVYRATIGPYNSTFGLRESFDTSVPLAGISHDRG